MKYLEDAKIKIQMKFLQELIKEWYLNYKNMVK